MPTEAVNIKVLVAAGVPAPGAIKAALGRNGVQGFAARKGFRRPNVSACIYGRQRQEKIRAALAEELRVDRVWLDEQLNALKESEREDTTVSAQAHPL